MASARPSTSISSSSSASLISISSSSSLPSPPPRLLTELLTFTPPLTPPILPLHSVSPSTISTAQSLIKNGALRKMRIRKGDREFEAQVLTNTTGGGGGGREKIRNPVAIIRCSLGGKWINSSCDCDEMKSRISKGSENPIPCLHIFSLLIYMKHAIETAQSTSSSASSSNQNNLKFNQKPLPNASSSSLHTSASTPSSLPLPSPALPSSTSPSRSPLPSVSTSSAEYLSTLHATDQVVRYHVAPRAVRAAAAAGGGGGIEVIRTAVGIGIGIGTGKGAGGIGTTGAGGNVHLVNEVSASALSVSPMEASFDSINTAVNEPVDPLHWRCRWCMYLNSIEATHCKICKAENSNNKPNTTADARPAATTVTTSNSSSSTPPPSTSAATTTTASATAPVVLPVALPSSTTTTPAVPSSILAASSFPPPSSSSHPSTSSFPSLPSTLTDYIPSTLVEPPADAAIAAWPAIASTTQLSTRSGKDEVLESFVPNSLGESSTVSTSSNRRSRRMIKKVAGGAVAAVAAGATARLRAGLAIDGPDGPDARTETEPVDSVAQDSVSTSSSPTSNPSRPPSPSPSTAPFTSTLPFPSSSSSSSSALSDNFSSDPSIRAVLLPDEAHPSAVPIPIRFTTGTKKERIAVERASGTTTRRRSNRRVRFREIEEEQEKKEEGEKGGWKGYEEKEREMKEIDNEEEKTIHKRHLPTFLTTAASRARKRTAPRTTAATRRSRLAAARSAAVAAGGGGGVGDEGYISEDGTVMNTDEMRRAEERVAREAAGEISAEEAESSSRRGRRTDRVRGRGRARGTLSVTTTAPEDSASAAAHARRRDRGRGRGRGTRGRISSTRSSRAAAASEAATDASDSESLSDLSDSLERGSVNPSARIEVEGEEGEREDVNALLEAADAAIGSRGAAHLAALERAKQRAEARAKTRDQGRDSSTAAGRNRVVDVNRVEMKEEADNLIEQFLNADGGEEEEAASDSLRRVEESAEEKGHTQDLKGTSSPYVSNSQLDSSSSQKPRRSIQAVLKGEKLSMEQLQQHRKFPPPSSSSSSSSLPTNQRSSSSRRRAPESDSDSEIELEDGMDSILFGDVKKENSSAVAPSAIAPSGGSASSSDAFSASASTPFIAPASSPSTATTTPARSSSSSSSSSSLIVERSSSGHLQWKCNQCTLLVNIRLNKCTACDFPKPTATRAGTTTTAASGKRELSQEVVMGEQRKEREVDVEMGGEPVIDEEQSPVERNLTITNPSPAPSFSPVPPHSSGVSTPDLPTLPPATAEAEANVAAIAVENMDEKAEFAVPKAPAEDGLEWKKRGVKREEKEKKKPTPQSRRNRSNAAPPSRAKTTTTSSSIASTSSSTTINRRITRHSSLVTAADADEGVVATGESRAVTVAAAKPSLKVDHASYDESERHLDEQLDILFEEMPIRTPTTLAVMEAPDAENEGASHPPSHRQSIASLDSMMEHKYDTQPEEEIQASPPTFSSVSVEEQLHRSYHKRTRTAIVSTNDSNSTNSPKRSKRSSVSTSSSSTSLPRHLSSSSIDPSVLQAIESEVESGKYSVIVRKQMEMKEREERLRKRMEAVGMRATQLSEVQYEKEEEEQQGEIETEEKEQAPLIRIDRKSEMNESKEQSIHPPPDSSFVPITQERFSADEFAYIASAGGTQHQFIPLPSTHTSTTSSSASISVNTKVEVPWSNRKKEKEKEEEKELESLLLTSKQIKQTTRRTSTSSPFSSTSRSPTTPKLPLRPALRRLALLTSPTTENDEKVSSGSGGKRKNSGVKKALTARSSSRKKRVSFQPPVEMGESPSELHYSPKPAAAIASKATAAVSTRINPLRLLQASTRVKGEKEGKPGGKQSVQAVGSSTSSSAANSISSSSASTSAAIVAPAPTPPPVPLPLFTLKPIDPDVVIRKSSRRKGLQRK